MVRRWVPVAAALAAVLVVATVGLYLRTPVDAGVGPLEGATVWPDRHLVVEGVADEGEPVWANDVELTGLVGEPQETTYLRRGCIPMDAALGTDATVEDQVTPIAEPTGL